MGWLQLVGSSKLQVSFAEHSLFYRALLQKRPIIWRSLLIVATPYIYCCHYMGHYCMNIQTLLSLFCMLLSYIVVHSYIGWPRIHKSHPQRHELLESHIFSSCCDSTTNPGFDFTDITGTDTLVCIDYKYRLSEICTTSNQYCLLLLFVCCVRSEFPKVSIYTSALFMCSPKSTIALVADRFPKVSIYTSWISRSICNKCNCTLGRTHK